MNTKKFLTFILVLILPYLSFKTMDLPYWQVMALFSSVVILWFSELIPLSVTGLLVPILAILMGVSDVTGAFSPFGNQILFLFMGSFFLAKSMEKHGWDRRMAFTLLSSPFGPRSLKGVVIQLGLLCWVLSMWISNTATCAIVVPMVLGLLQTLQRTMDNELHQKNLRKSLLLTCAFASSIGGMATPVGSPPNLLAIQFLKNKGIDISFVSWMGYGLPISLSMLALLFVLIFYRFPLPSFNLSEIKHHFTEEREKLGKIKIAEVQIMIVFFLCVFLWLLPGMAKLLMPASTISQNLSSLLPMGGVGILCASLLFILSNNNEPNLTWAEANTIDWGTIWLFGGGLTMGSILEKSGFAAYAGEFLFGHGTIGFLGLGVIVIVAGIILSEFSSNTASTAILVPLLLGSLAEWGTGPTTSLIIAAAFGASFGFMLPVSTPPNAIVYGTGLIPLKDMMRTGVLFDIFGGMIIWFFLMVVF